MTRDWSRWLRQVGQFRSILFCPICQDPHTNGEKWACASCTPLINVHRELIRNLQHWRALYEAMEVPDVLVQMVDDEPKSYSLWDVQVFYDHRTSLADRQREAIEFCLFENMKEKDASVRMGIKATSPCSIYATIGITYLLGRAVVGALPGYFIELTYADPKPEHLVFDAEPELEVAG